MAASRSVVFVSARYNSTRLSMSDSNSLPLATQPQRHYGAIRCVRVEVIGAVCPCGSEAERNSTPVCRCVATTIATGYDIVN